MTSWYCIPTRIGIVPDAVSAATIGTYGGAVASFELRGIADPTYGIGVCVDNLFPFVPWMEFFSLFFIKI